MRKLILASAIALALAGCGSTPTTDQPGAKVEDRTPTKPTTPSDQGTTVKPVQAEQPTGSPLAALKDPNSILSKRSVYFDFDSFVVKDEAKPLIEAHAKFLVANPTVKMLIQGNTDERGTREYNIALGQKRAEAVKKALTLLGAKDAQIESVSLGEEKPKCGESSESCWGQNRRGDMLYSGEF